MLSIIIAFGKGKEYLKDCFDSIKEQDYKDIETVLVLDKANKYWRTDKWVFTVN